MIAMKFTIELDIGLSFLVQAALPELVTDRETKLIVVGGPSDRTAFADATLRSRKRKRGRATSQHRRAFAQCAPTGRGVSLQGRPVIVAGTRPHMDTAAGSGRPGIGLSQEQVPQQPGRGPGPGHIRIRRGVAIAAGRGGPSRRTFRVRDGRLEMPVPTRMRVSPVRRRGVRSGVGSLPEPPRRRGCAPGFTGSVATHDRSSWFVNLLLGRSNRVEMDETELLPEATALLVRTLRSAVLAVSGRLDVKRTGRGEQ
jgi:hypothetical protein